MNERLTVLVVDDEQPVLAAAAAVLSEDFRVLTAPNAAGALRLMEHHRVDVLCTDLNMPGRNGIQLLREALGRQPHLSGVLATRHSEYLQKRGAHDALGLYYLLIKPYLPARLTVELGALRRVA